MNERRSKAARKREAFQVERLTQALLPYVKPDWWGWTELSESGKRKKGAA